ncbi:MAG TPA: hypothetical protein VJ743_13265 [Albitalea sp.]|nr:hypothetical protein [Albitalea sp.]
MATRQAPPDSSRDRERDRPEAGADTDQGRRGTAPDAHPADSGGTRTRAGSDYGDFVPDRGQPRRNDDRDAGDPAMGDYYSGGGRIDQLGEQRASSSNPPRAAEGEPTRSPQDKTLPEKEETAVESNRNKGFDTTHVHSGTTTRKV